MKDIEQIISGVKELEERFLEKEVDTGDPADDVDTGPIGDGEFNEFDAFTNLAGSSAVSCMIAIESILRGGHKERLSKMFGEDAESLLRQTQECLQGIADLFDMDEEGEEELSDEEPSEEEEEEPKEEEPKEKPETPEKEKEKPEEK
jgi:hypothetical protein